MTDPDSYARSFALEHGADQAFDPSSPGAESQLAEYAPEGYEVAFEASGSAQALRLAILACARGATIVQIGTLPGNSILPANLIMSKEQALLGSFRFANVFEKVLEMIAGGRYSVDHIVTAAFPIEELPAAVEAAARKGSVIKVQVRA